MLWSLHVNNTKAASVCYSSLAVVVSILRTLCCAYKFHFHTQQILFDACFYPVKFQYIFNRGKSLNSFWCWFIYAFFLSTLARVFQWLNDNSYWQKKSSRIFKSANSLEKWWWINVTKLGVHTTEYNWRKKIYIFRRMEVNSHIKKSHT